MTKARIRRPKRSTKILPDPGSPRAGRYEPQAPEFISAYLAEERDSTNLKLAGVGALIAHLILFFVVIPTAEVEPIPLTDRVAATIVKRYTPPAPPSRPKKTTRRNLNPIPIPDPTPRDPEPILEEDSAVEFGDPDAEFDVGLPNAPPGPGGARVGAVRNGAGGLSSPIVTRKVLPEYSASATRAGIQGEVYIEAVVTAEGKVEDPELIRGLSDEELNRQALEAILDWEFQPGTMNGEPVAVIAMFTVAFRIH